VPFKSKSQMRLFFAKEKRGELPAGTAEEWAGETPDIGALPDRKKKARAYAVAKLKKKYDKY
jgi:hypothetical protein